MWHDYVVLCFICQNKTSLKDRERIHTERGEILFFVLCSSYILFPGPVSFRLFDCSQPLYTPAVWHNVNPLLDHRVHFASLHTSQRLLDYLQSSAVVLELWGLQGEGEENRREKLKARGIIKAADRRWFCVSEGCTDLTSSLEGVRMTTDGVFIMEEAGPTDTSVSFMSVIPCHKWSSHCDMFLKLNLTLTYSILHLPDSKIRMKTLELWNHRWEEQ